MTSETYKQRGYSYHFIKTIEAADPSLLGVQLGLWAIKNDVSVMTIADALAVSRQTVYAWMVGRFVPAFKFREPIAALLAKPM